MECAECHYYKDGQYFSSNQWRQGNGRAMCTDCVHDRTQVRCNCQYCGREFNCRNSLDMHIPSCIPTCNQCGRTFQSQNSLSQHMKSHATRVLKCPLCQGPKQFKNGANVVAHVESGFCTGCVGKDAARDQIFQFVSRNAPSLTVPMLENGGYGGGAPARPYQCSYCSKTFAHLSAQMNHEGDVHANNRGLNQLGW